MPKIQYKYYMLILLTVVATFNYVDRFVLSLALEPIKQEFQLSDSQLGLMTGFAFASFYAIADYFDRSERPRAMRVLLGIYQPRLEGENRGYQ